MDNVTSPAAPVMIHKFEEAGLGKAPFRYVGCSRKVGPLLIGESGGCQMWVGSPGQPMGTCAYCSQGIADCFHVRSADGKEFIVGCDCILKVGDAGLKRVVADAVRKAQNDRRHEREAAKIAQLKAWLALPEVRAALAAKAHPFGWSGKTLLDQVEWMMKNAGNAGKTRVWKLVAEVAPQQ